MELGERRDQGRKRSQSCLPGMDGDDTEHSGEEIGGVAMSWPGDSSH